VEHVDEHPRAAAWMGASPLRSVWSRGANLHAGRGPHSRDRGCRDRAHRTTSQPQLTQDPQGTFANTGAPECSPVRDVAPRSRSRQRPSMRNRQTRKSGRSRLPALAWRSAKGEVGGRSHIQNAKPHDPGIENEAEADDKCPLGQVMHCARVRASDLDRRATPSNPRPAGRRACPDTFANTGQPGVLFVASGVS
jgi:hypothetical protein